MSTHAYTEDQLVEQPAIGLFAALGWQTMSASEEIFGVSSEERGEVKKVARELLERVKNLLVIDWRRRQNSRARVEDAIKDVLDTGLPRAYDKALYEEKCSALFEHVYESYSAA